MFGFAFEDSGNDVGVGYILMEKLPGVPLSHTDLNEPQIERTIIQPADVFIEVRGYPFDRIGSLGKPDTSHVG